MDSKHAYQASNTNNYSASSSGSSSNTRAAEPTTSPYADSKDVVSDSTAPPPYTRYANEQPRQPEPQSVRQPQTQPQMPRQYESSQYQPAAPRQPQPQTQEYRYQADVPQDYGYGHVSGRGMGPMGRRRGMGGGPLHMLMNDRLSNQQYQSRQDMYAQPGYGYEYDDRMGGFGRRGRRGRRGGGGPLHMLFNEAAKRL